MCVAVTCISRELQHTHWKLPNMTTQQWSCVSYVYALLIGIADLCLGLIDCRLHVALDCVRYSAEGQYLCTTEACTAMRACRALQISIHAQNMAAFGYKPGRLSSLDIVMHHAHGNSQPGCMCMCRSVAHLQCCACPEIYVVTQVMNNLLTKLLQTYT